MIAQGRRPAGLGCRGARATAPGCPVSEVGRGRAAVAPKAWIGTGANEDPASSRASASATGRSGTTRVGRCRDRAAAGHDVIHGRARNAGWAADLEDCAGTGAARTRSAARSGCSAPSAATTALR